MRPIAKAQDALRFPLNDLLGTRATVRLLRLLAWEASEPVGAPEAAERTGVTEAGARRALRRLAETGLVEHLGGGRAQRFRLREADPLAVQVRNLFRLESERFQRLKASLSTVRGALQEVHVAWIDSFPRHPGEPLQIGIIGDARSLTYLEEQVRQRIADIESAFDLTIEMRLLSRAEASELNWRERVLLVGHVAESSHGAGLTHSERTTRAQKVSGFIAEILERDPTLMNRARRHIELLLEADQGAASHDLREWHAVLSQYSRRRVTDFLTSDTPRAQRLRQSSPFFAVLTPDERDEVLSRLEGKP
jgi:DNA-binding Lrp family transcriptional regulator